MYDVGGPFDWEEYIKQQQRAGYAAGGVAPPPDPSTQPNLDDYTGDGGLEDVRTATPSPAQTQAKNIYGIGSTGPLAQKANENVDQYNADKSASFDRIHQMEPQQFGTTEGTFLDKGPLKPADAAEAFMATNPKAPHRVYTTPEEQLAKNQAYDTKVDADRKVREEQRNRQRQQGYENRAASREKDADMWSQFRAINPGASPGMASGGGGFGVPFQSGQGPILLPGMGRPAYDYGGYGRGGPRINIDPLGEDKLAIRRQQEERLARQGDTKNELGKGQLALGGQRVAVAEKGIDAANTRAENQLAHRNEQEANVDRDELDHDLADFNRRFTEYQKTKNPEDLDRLPAKPDPNNPGAVIPGVVYGGSYEQLQERILHKTRKLHNSTKKIGYDFRMTPEQVRLVEQIAALRGNKNAATPNIDQ